MSFVLGQQGHNEVGIHVIKLTLATVKFAFSQIQIDIYTPKFAKRAHDKDVNSSLSFQVLYILICIFAKGNRQLVNYLYFKIFARHKTSSNDNVLSMFADLLLLSFCVKQFWIPDKYLS